MDISLSQGLRLLPQTSPYPTPDLPIELAESLQQRPEEEALALEWAYALADEFRLKEIAHSIEDFELATYGFLDPETELDAFGVICYAKTAENNLTNPKSNIFGYIELYGHYFPIVVRSYNLELSVADVHPQTGRSTSWAGSHATGSGILTAGHVVDSFSDPSQIPVREPSGTIANGSVIHRAPGGIDAALIELPRGAPGPGVQLNIEDWPAPWSDVTLIRARGPRTTKVTAISDTRGVLSSPNVPGRVFIAKPGVSGDSGCPCLQVRDGSYIGLYMGRLKTQAGNEEGVLQHLGQVKLVMSIDMWE